MKGSRRYIVFAVLLAAVLLGKLNTWNDDYGEVEAFRGAQLQDEVFYPLKAKNVNEAGLATLTVGDQVYRSYGGKIAVNDALHLMGSLDFVQTVFGASVHVYDGEKILLERNGDTCTLALNQTEGSRNGMFIQFQDAPILHEGNYYLPLQDLCTLFSCAYSWDETTYAAVMEGGSEQVKLPEKYDLRKRERAGKIKDQGSTATCWAYAALGSLESALLPQESEEYSVNHMTQQNAFDLPVKSGGDYTMAAAYLLSWDGPRDDGGRVKKHVQEVQFFDRENLEAMKWAVYQHGGVSTSIYVNVTTSDLEKSPYYNKKTNAYCYQGERESNHDVVIIGWDDNYKAENFVEDVPGNGAFICQNSWGEDFGEQGVFYISYYDANIGMQSAAYTRVEDVDNYDSIYQSDLCGWVGSLGYNKERIMAANVFERQGNQQIAAAGFYALGKNTSYQIYVVPDFQGVASLANRMPAASGFVENRGFYTIDFEKPADVTGEKFAIVIMLETPASTLPMAIEYESGERTKNVDISDGEGYISNNGLDWENVEKKAKGNLCLKAYGKEKSEG